MGVVIEFPENEDGSGYVTSDNSRRITGVYVNNVAAIVKNGNVYLGTKSDDGVTDALLTNEKDMNRFCLMWLGISDPDVLKNEVKGQ